MALEKVPGDLLQSEMAILTQLRTLFEVQHVSHSVLHSEVYNFIFGLKQSYKVSNIISFRLHIQANRSW